MSHLLVEQRDGIAIVTLNRPEKRNAMSPEMIVRLAQFWSEIATDHSVRVVVVTGAGDQAFSAGGDLGSLIPLMMRTRAPQGEWEERFSTDRKQLGAALLRNATFFKPVIAAINGHAHAGGAEFVMSTDLRVMSSTATIAVTEVRRGLIASGGSLVRMARQVPWAHAMELLLLGEPISAERALAMGLVNRVVPPNEVLNVALDLARRVSLGAPVALEKTKEVVVRSSGLPLEEAFAIETQCTKENAAMDDAKEGPRAFMEKRPPVFRGRNSQ
jgi:enoyl-CoA hydratase